MRRHVLLFLALTSLSRAAWPQGAPLGLEFRINTYTDQLQFQPSVAADSAGNFVVAWSSRLQDGGLYGVFAQRYTDSGVPLGGEFRVNTYTTFSQYLPAVASDAAGNFVVVWSTPQDGWMFGVFGQRYASTGAPLGPEFRANTYTIGDQIFSAIASSSTGDYVVVWCSYDQDGSDAGVFGQRYASSGAALGPEFRINSYTSFAQRAPAVASDAAGNFVVVWQSSFQDGSYVGIFGQRYASTGVPLGAEFRVNSHTTGQQRQPSVAGDPSGDFIVVWHGANQDGSGYGVFGQRYQGSGAPLGGEFRVNSYTMGNQYLPALAIDASGNFVVAWQDDTQDGSTWGVFAQRYRSSGLVEGPEFRVNTYTTLAQVRPAAAAAPLGNFVITWDSQSQDGSVGGVYGQRFGMIVPVELMRFEVE